MSEKILLWFAWLLPRRLVYWCAIRLTERSHRPTHRITRVCHWVFP
jgi:hypothetical protein